MKMENALEHLISKALVQVGEALGMKNIDPEPGLIFITGIHDVVSYRVAKRLLNAGYPKVRIGHSDGRSLFCKEIEEMNKLGAEIATDFDWKIEDTYEKALAGVKTVFISPPYCKDWDEQMNFLMFLQVCKKVGTVKHIIKSSFYHADVSGDPYQTVPLVRAHGTIDENLSKFIKENGEHLSYTILGAMHYMSTPFQFQGKELRREDINPAIYYGANKFKRCNFVSPNDVSEVAVRCLLDPKEHYNKVYTLLGPESITNQDITISLSKHLKKPIMYVDQPLHTYEDTIKMNGLPGWLVRDLVEFEKLEASGIEEKIDLTKNDVEKICGHEPETFETYLTMKDYMTTIEAGV